MMIKTCNHCSEIQEIEKLEKVMVDRVHSSFGYFCSVCGAWVHEYYMNPTLLDKEATLNRLKPGTGKYLKAFTKFREKFSNLQERLEAATWRAPRQEPG